MSTRKKKGAHKFWTEDRETTLVLMWKAGIGAARIGESVGCGSEMVYKKAGKMGLPKRPKYNGSPTLVRDEINCLRCKKLFKTANKKSNRICVRCKQSPIFSHDLATAYEVYA